jgi:hypothetical protein
VSGSVNRALGDIAMWFDIIPTWFRRKLRRDEEGVEAGTAEFDYMLATILFDVVKKNALMHKALRQFALHADPALTQRYLADLHEYEELGQDYEQLAYLAEEKMLEAIEESFDDHLDLAEMVLRFNGRSVPDRTF